MKMMDNETMDNEMMDNEMMDNESNIDDVYEDNLIMILLLHSIYKDV